VNASFPVFQPESPEAQAIYDLFVAVLWISAGIFIIVAGLICIALVRGRASVALPKQDFGSHRREILWIAGPIIIVLWIGAISAKLILTINAYPQVDSPQDIGSDSELSVIGHQWWWEIRYNDSGRVAANEIHIPVGKKIRVAVKSADVIHSFWVPQLGRKIDAIPGRNNFVWLQASRPGAYQGRCAEFCGNQHAWMNFTVFAHNPEEYERWEVGGQVIPVSVKDTEAAAGERLFFAQTCVNCHAIDGTPAVTSIGPNLTHVSSRKEIGGGILQNTPANLRRWLKNPQAIKPGCKMPNFNFTDEQVHQLASYLESLD
jgi:cytochrome c oxidase subunit 2